MCGVFGHAGERRDMHVEF